MLYKIFPNLLRITTKKLVLLIGKSLLTDFNFRGKNRPLLIYLFILFTPLFKGLK